MDTESSNQLDLSSLGSFDFTPDWAKKDAGVSVGKFRPERESAPRRGDSPRNSSSGDRPRYSDGPRPAERPRGDRPYEERKGFGDRKPFGERKPFGDRKGFGERKGFGDAPSRSFGGTGRKPFGERPRVERPRPLNVEVKVLPETKALGTIIRKLQSDSHAYKLKDLAYFFLDNPQSILLKVSPKSGDGSQIANSKSQMAGGRTTSTSTSASTSRSTSTSASTSTSTSNLQPSTCFYQCKACGFASTSRAEVEEHALNSHIGDYFVAKEVDCEPPKGNFNCVAKCGLSGVLLGPPNIHEFAAVVKEMVRTKYPQMSEEQYRAHIEMVRDPEAIEEWRKGATKKTVFFAKGTEDVEGAVSLTRDQVEGEFRRTILASLVDAPKNLMITADVALASPVKPLVWAVRDALEAERRAPYGMCFALRGAFHHRKLNFFRVNDARGQEFVTSAAYKPFDAAHAIPELAKVANFVAEHPCCSKQEAAPDEETAKHLSWLVSTGHVVAFTNGVFSPVEKFPKYGPQWRKKKSEVGGQGVAGASSPRPDENGTVAGDRGEDAPATEDVDAKSVRVEEEVVVVSEQRGEDSASPEEKKDEAAAQLAE